jgi:hypothetical protein
MARRGRRCPRPEAPPLSDATTADGPLGQEDVCSGFPRGAAFHGGCCINRRSAAFAEGRWDETCVCRRFAAYLGNRPPIAHDCRHFFPPLRRQRFRGGLCNSLPAREQRGVERAKCWSSRIAAVELRPLRCKKGQHEPARFPAALTRSAMGNTRRPLGRLAGSCKSYLSNGGSGSPGSC